jgi:hypothetical protein
MLDFERVPDQNRTLDLQHLIAVVIVVLLPFLPVLLLDVPLNVILRIL